MLFIIANMLEKINESKISEWFNKANGISGILIDIIMIQGCWKSLFKNRTYSCMYTSNIKVTHTT